MEEDDKIKDLFSDFQPELSTSDGDFLAQLRRSMAAVELVRRQHLARRRDSRKALAVAALTGFAVGVIFTLLIPFVGDCISTFSISSVTVTIDYGILCRFMAATASCLTAINACRLALGKNFRR